MSEEGKRFILTFPKTQMEQLKRLSYVEDKSIAEIVRNAVTKYMQSHEMTTRENEIIKNHTLKEIERKLSTNNPKKVWGKQ